MKAVQFSGSGSFSNSKLAKITLAFVAFSFLAACGSSKTSGKGFGDLSTASTAAPSSAVPQEAAKALCSQDTGAAPALQVRLMQYVDPQGQSRSDVIRLQFKKAPSGWQTGNWDMKIYRWTAAPDNSTSIDETPLQFQFEKKAAAGFQLLTNTQYPIFNWDEIRAMGQYANISAASPQDFFNTASLLVHLKDTTNSYQVLRVVFRQGSTIMAQTDVLIPTFDADPSKYNADKRHPGVLQNLHPLKDKLGQSWTQANYYEFARAFCF